MQQACSFNISVPKLPPPTTGALHLKFDGLSRSFPIPSSPETLSNTPFVHETGLIWCCLLYTSDAADDTPC
eukprot:4475916-Amphidinium_carterae.1